MWRQQLDTRRSKLIEKYGIELLRFIDDDKLQLLFMDRLESGEAEISNVAIGEALLNTSVELRERALRNLNRIRQEKVASWIRSHETPSTEAGLPPAQACTRSQEEILKKAMKLEEHGVINFNVDCSSSRGSWKADLDTCPGRYRSFKQFAQDHGMGSIGEKAQVDEPGAFDLTAMTCEKIARYWLPLCRSFRREGIILLDRLLDKIRDDFSRTVFELAMDDGPDEELLAQSRTARERHIEEYERSLELMRKGIMAIRDEKDPERILSICRQASQLCEPLDSEIQSTAKSILKPAVTVGMSQAEIITNILAFSFLIRSQGIFALEDYDVECCPYFRFGLRALAECYDDFQQDRILLNKKETLLADCANRMKLFEMICLALRNKYSTYMAWVCLSSFLVEDIDFGDI